MTVLDTAAFDTAAPQSVSLRHRPPRPGAKTPPTPRRRRDRDLRQVRAAVFVFAVALVLRLIAITRAYELFIDEITYSAVGHNLASGHGLSLYGQPFTLHPPAMFGLDAIVIDVFGIHGTADHFVLALRPVSGVFGALVCAGVYLLVERAAGRRAALVAGLLLALDPFAISYDSLVMLEPYAGAASVAAIGFVAAAAQARSGTRRRAVFVGLAGLMTAIVVTTKLTFGLVVMATLLVLWFTRWVLRRREMAAVIAVGAAGYLVYLAVLATIGDLGSWWSNNVDGLLRLVGAKQETGFNSPTVHVSLVSRGLADLSGTASSYVILILGPIAAFLLLRSMRPWHDDWADRATIRQRAAVAISVWTLAATAYVAYATLFGSIEEQMYYILIGPSLCAIPVAVTTLRVPDPARGVQPATAGSAKIQERRRRRAAAPSLVAALLAVPVGIALAGPASYRRPGALPGRHRRGRRLSGRIGVVLLGLGVITSRRRRRSDGPGRRKGPARRPPSTLRSSVLATVLAVPVGAALAGPAPLRSSDGARPSDRARPARRGVRGLIGAAVLATTGYVVASPGRRTGRRPPPTGSAPPPLDRAGVRVEPPGVTLDTKWHSPSMLATGSIVATGAVLPTGTVLVTRSVLDIQSVFSLRSLVPAVTRPHHATLRRAGAALAGAALLYNGVVWYGIHTKASNGYTQLLDWASTHVPPGSTGSVTDGSTQFLLTGVNLGNWDTLAELRAHEVQWVIVSTRLIDQGYTASPGFLDLLEHRGRLLYSSTLPIGLRVYSVANLTGAA
jgi:4-amino-4-deoxy-L-arabinose transferase-like glycosyltransferase